MSEGGTAEEPPPSDDPAGEDPPMPRDTPEISRRVWGALFLGPVVVVLVTGVAGTTGTRSAAVWAFTLGVWAFTLMVGFALAPGHDDADWLARTVLGSFISAGLALALLYGTSAVGKAADNNTQPTATTTKVTTTSSTAAPTTSSSTP